jgi:hypothetical protein
MHLANWKGGKIPLISETLDALSGAKLFSSIDFASGYLQMGMDKKIGKNSIFD